MKPGQHVGFAAHNARTAASMVARARGQVYRAMAVPGLTAEQRARVEDGEEALRRAVRELAVALECFKGIE